MEFKCYYCSFGTNNFQTCIAHTSQTHVCETLKIQRQELDCNSGVLGYRTQNFSVIPETLFQMGKEIRTVELGDKLGIEIVDIEMTKLETIESEDDDIADISDSGNNEIIDNLENLSLLENTPSKSPAAKKIRTSTPYKSNVSPTIESDNTSTDLTLSLTLPAATANEDVLAMEEFLENMPATMQCLKDAGHFETWMAFHRLISKGQFPLNNIAFLLFLDVCKLLSTPSSVSMRYSPVVKRFWRIGYRMFRGKWLHFMSGPKYKGQCQNSDRIEYRPEEACINFAVPHRTIIIAKDDALSASDIKPGMLDRLVDNVSEQSTPLKTYKLCVDGKKINSSLSSAEGDIDLFGFEGSPTLAEKRERLRIEQSRIQEVSDRVRELNIMGKHTLGNLSESDSTLLAEKLSNIVYILSNRLKELRESKVHKDLTCEKLKKQSGSDWRKSNLVYVISGLETTLFDISNCIKSLLKCIDELCLAITVIKRSVQSFCQGQTLSLQHQNNYIHLRESKENQDVINTRHIRQRTDAWLKLRSTAKVTGSTLNNAIGLGTLKAQQEHFDSVVYNNPKPAPSESTKECMEHGTVNEINAIATLVGKVLPVYWPNLQYVEEGCFQIFTEESGVSVVISPDGSCRESVNAPSVFAIECKCPMPGEVFTTPVFYSIPKYYVPQLLAEMKALNSTELLFVCYTKESTTVHKVQFCEELWQLIIDETENVYGSNPSRPKKKSATVVDIANMINTFLKEKVQFIGEVTSVQAMECNSQQSSDQSSPYCLHHSYDRANQDVTMKAVLCLNHEVKSCLDKAYKLCRTRATEFLGFMISDLDREYNPENYHAVPIAYALKGYSLPIDVLRKMIEHVLIECQRKGLYTPVCSFDGQWCRMAVRDRYNRPLTILQLQKDTYSEVRNLSKGGLINLLSEMNVVQLTEDTQIEDIVELECKENSIIVGGKKDGDRIVPSAHIVRMIRHHEASDSKQKKDAVNESSEKTDEVLSSLPGDMLNDMEDNLLESVVSVSTSVQNLTEIDISPEDIFPEIEDKNTLRDENVIQIMQVAEDNVASDNASAEIQTNDQTNHEVTTGIKSLLSYEDLQNMLSHLTTCELNRKNKWNISFETYRSKLTSAKEIDKNFTKAELIQMLQPVLGKIKSSGRKCNVSSPKYVLVNLLSDMLGDGSEIQKAKKERKLWNPQSLRNIAKKSVQQIPKSTLNCVYAEHIFPQKLKDWNRASPFGKTIEINNVDCLSRQWYSQPEYNDQLGNYLFVVLDAYHQLCGLRRAV